jgi:hypothetical protein
MRDNKEFLYDENNTTFFSLTKLTGKKIADITGYPSDPFGEAPIFKLFQIIFEDGTSSFVEGEHDVPYISGDGIHNLDEETLQSFIDEE